MRELAASTVFTLLYIGAIEGANIYLGPAHVYRMTSEQAALTDDSSRIAYRENVLRKGFTLKGMRWYADNTREPIRDETLREGLIQIGAVISLSGMATTSSKPRYALKAAFASLFDPKLTSEKLEDTIQAWQKANLSKSALTRLSLAQLGAKSRTGDVLVTFPNGETRNLSAGLSSEISKAVIEVFTRLFLEDPVVLWLSTSGDKVITKDDKVATSIGLRIEADKNLPDIILVDLGAEDPLLVFVEVVATDGPITERRQQAIYALTDAANFKPSQVAFVTAYLDRQSAGFKKTIAGLAWNSFAWIVSEPEAIIVLKNGVSHLTKIIELKR